MGPVPEPQTSLTFALPKGRILDQATPLFAAAGIDIAAALDEAGRKLLFELASPEHPSGSAGAPTWRFLLVKPVDVPTYVEHGIADFGIAGLDTLREQGRDLYEPVDLGIGRCRLAVAEPRDRPEHLRRGLRRGMALRVATKYPACALRHYRSKGIQPDIIPLFGSVELGPVTGLADQIVDLVESGETLRQNELVEVETIFEVSSRLIVNAASLRLKQPAVSRTIAALRRAVEQAAGEAETKAVSS